MVNAIRIIIFTSILFPAFNTIAQENPELVKAAILNQITKNIFWPKSDKQEFSITVYGNDAAMYNILAPIEQQKTHNLPIKRYQSTDLNILKQSHVVYIPSAYKLQVAELALALTNTNTLLITDEATSKANLMINLMITKGEIHFQVNRANILNEGLNIGEDLLLLGGTELDVREIYRDMRSNMKIFEDKLQESDLQLNSSRQQVEQTEQQLLTLNQQVSLSQKKIDQQNNQLISYQDRFRLVQNELSIKNSELALFLAEYEQLKLNIDNVNKDLATKLAAFSLQEEKYNKLQAKMSLGQDELILLEKQINEKNNLLNSQSLELGLKTEKIAQQKYTLITIILISIVILVVAGFILLLLLQYKKLTKKLSYSNATLITTQKKLIEQEKFAALGQLIAGVAHELNTPLGIAITGASCIEDQAKACSDKVTAGILKKKDLVNFLATVEQAQSLATKNLQRCVDLIASFKKVSTDQNFSKEQNIHIKSYIIDIIHTLEVELKRNQIGWMIEGENPIIYVDPGFIAQVINNLVMNAVQHAFDNIDNKNIKLILKTDNSSVYIDVIDNGIGMSEKTLSHLFDPFFTTKRNRGGTGLGMNIVYNLVVQNMKGEINAYSKEHKGTRIVIKLPLSYQA